MLRLVDPISFQSAPPHGRRLQAFLLARGLHCVSIRASAREATLRRSGPATPGNGFNPRLRTGGDPLRRRPRWPALHRFNPRLRTGGDGRSVGCASSPSRFQSAPPHGRRRGASPSSADRVRFNPRLRTGGDPFPGTATILVKSFNPRLRTGGDEVLPLPLGIERGFQSAPPHGRRLQRGAEQLPSLLVSIRASAREATPRPRIIEKLKRCFNPRLRTGGDHGDANARSGGVEVSIRASAREATPCRRAASSRAKRFQSAPPHGRRRVMTPVEAPPIIGFNPRLRTGGDLSLPSVDCADRRFQSAPPHGRRLVPLPTIPRAGSVSIRASAREATLQPGPLNGRLGAFQSAPPHGRRRAPVSPRGRAAIPFQSAPPHGRRRARASRSGSFRGSFNPRLRTGGDPGNGQGTARHRPRFQSAPPHGRRPWRRAGCSARASSFNPRLRTGGDGLDVRDLVDRKGFQSAPPHGRRRPRCRTRVRSCIRFNPRLRTGGDSRTPPSLSSMSPCFNPRLRTGGDKFSATPWSPVARFQSAPPHGRRRHRSTAAGPRCCRFNPRLRTGGDPHEPR